MVVCFLKIEGAVGGQEEGGWVRAEQLLLMTFFRRSVLGVTGGMVGWSDMLT